MNQDSCYPWVDGIAGQQAQEVGSRLIKHILTTILEGTEELYFGVTLVAVTTVTLIRVVKCNPRIILICMLKLAFLKVLLCTLVISVRKLIL